MTSDESKNQVARISDCNNCGHCVELYTPDFYDSGELQETRQMIYDWINDLFTEAGHVNQIHSPMEFMQ
jgi:hypothetical protein